MSARQNVHGTAILLGTTGVLLRGPSGAGKSLLALALIDDWEARGLPASLVADDRVDLALGTGTVTMHVPPQIGGKIELRGRGIIERAYTAEASLGLVVDLVATLERMPEENAFAIEELGLDVPRCPVPQAGVIELGHQIMLVREAIRDLGAPPRKNT